MSAVVLALACGSTAAYVSLASSLPEPRSYLSVRNKDSPTMSVQGTTTRRQAVQAALVWSAAIGPSAAMAADPKTWISGKSDPIRPTSKDKPDGTKKDGKYLSCLNDCVPRKQGPPGPNQLERADCLDACQQECCTTYEQCTYTIRKF